MSEEKMTQMDKSIEYKFDGGVTARACILLIVAAEIILFIIMLANPNVHFLIDSPIAWLSSPFIMFPVLGIIIYGLLWGFGKWSKRRIK